MLFYIRLLWIEVNRLCYEWIVTSLTTLGNGIYWICMHLEVTTLLSSIKSWTNLRGLISLWSILDPLTFNSHMSFKTSKILYDLASESLLNLLTKLNYLFLKILFLLRIGMTSILFLVVLVILVRLAKQEDGWKLGWMSIVVKLKMKRFRARP